jgi:hypothetical protein
MMKVFLSYPSAKHEIAVDTELALLAEGYDVFLDRRDLSPGESFHKKIREEPRSSDLMVVFLTRESIARDSYTLAEIEIAKTKWRHPSGHVLVLKIGDVPLAEPPSYLRAVTVVTAIGNVPAIAVMRVADMADKLKNRELKRSVPGIAIVMDYQNIRIRAWASRPVTTRLELFVDGRDVASATRPWSTSVAAGLKTLVGFRQQWSLSANTRVGAKTVTVMAQFVTTFTNQYFELFVDGERITPPRS